VAHELRGQPIRRICHDGFRAGGRIPYQEEVDAIEIEIGGGHIVAGAARHVGDRAMAATWRPDDLGQRLGLELRLDRDRRRFVEVQATLARWTAGVAKRDGADRCHVVAPSFGNSARRRRWHLAQSQITFFAWPLRCA